VSNSEIDLGEVYEAIQVLIENYVEGDKQRELLSMIVSFRSKEQFPPGKGILYEIDQSKNETGKKLSKEHADLYKFVCEACI
jgi:hypothetical protein